MGYRGGGDQDLGKLPPLVAKGGFRSGVWAHPGKGIWKKRANISYAWPLRKEQIPARKALIGKEHAPIGRVA